jgi:serine/threonine protein kinase
MSNVRAGTKLYMAPEVIDDGIYNKLIDLWALGVFLH